ncbi:unnamed protein product [Eretmochelys imbricata]
MNPQALNTVLAFRSFARPLRRTQASWLSRQPLSLPLCICPAGGSLLIHTSLGGGFGDSSLPPPARVSRRTATAGADRAAGRSPVPQWLPGQARGAGKGAARGAGGWLVASMATGQRSGRSEHKLRGAAPRPRRVCCAPGPLRGPRAESVKRASARPRSPRGLVCPRDRGPRSSSRWDAAGLCRRETSRWGAAGLRRGRSRPRVSEPSPGSL